MGAPQQALLGGAGIPAGGEAGYDSWQVSPEGTPQSSFSLTSLPDNCLVILAIASGSTSNLDLNVSSGGWTELADLYANDTNDTNLAVFWQYYASGGNKSITLSHSCVWAASIILGAVAGNPFTGAALMATGTNNARPTPPTITVPDGSLILAIGAGNGGTGASQSIVPANSPEFATDNFDNGVNVCIAGYTDSRSGLAFSQWAHDAEVQSECSWAAVTLGIK